MSSAKDYQLTVVVIPTRNRADLAKRAIRSVLDQPGCDVRVMVSDNSTATSELQELEEYCAELDDPKLRYVKPPEPLSMSDHWEWAIDHALETYDASHFLYLTDRMMFKPLALKEVLERASVYSNKVISYNHDKIVDDRRPIRVEQYEYTGRLLEVKTLRLSYLYSQAIFHNGLPRMLNCIVPRELLDRMRQRFGSVFASIAPDFSFCCRCLEMEESILFYDKSPIFHYALDRSNGASTTRGEMTSDYIDFIANLPVDNAIRNYATPIPQLMTAINAVFNEYLIFKRETKSPRFFDVPIQNYLRVNAFEINEVTDPQLQAEWRALLEAHGLEDASNGLRPDRSIPALVRKLGSPKAVWGKLRSTFKATMTGRWTKSSWLFLARHFRIKPPAENAFVFGEIEEAIDYMKKFPRGSLTDGANQADLLQARQLPFRSQT